MDHNNIKQHTHHASHLDDRKPRQRQAPRMLGLYEYIVPDPTQTPRQNHPSNEQPVFSKLYRTTHINVTPLLYFVYLQFMCDENKKRLKGSGHEGPLLT
jgi:hypothetical protein